MEHIIGLKKFLQEMSLIDEKEVIEVKLWEEYLIFASILGIADKVQEQLGKMCPTFNEQSNLDTIYTMHMVHMFAYNSMRASASAHAQAEAADLVDLVVVLHLEEAEEASQVEAVAVFARRR